MTSWKTTLAGVAAMLGALADILTQLASKSIDTGRITTDVAAIAAGIGLLFAKDHNVTG